MALRLDDLAISTVTGPLKTVAFADGGALEIIGVSVGERVVEVNPPKRFKLPFFTNKGSSGGIWGGLNVNTEEEDDQVIRARLHSDDAPRGLLMEFRLLESNGTAMRLPNYLRQSGVWQDDRLVSAGSPSCPPQALRDARLPTCRYFKIFESEVRTLSPWTRAVATMI